MLKRLSLLVVVLLLLVSSVYAQDAGSMDCMGSEGSTLSVMASWAGEEEETFRSIVAPLLDACSITLNYEGTRDMNTLIVGRAITGHQAFA